MVTSSHQNRAAALTLLAHSSSQEPEDAVYEVIDGPDEKGMVSKPTPNSILYNLMMRRRNQLVEVTGERDAHDAHPWGFWLGSAALMGLIAFVALRGAGGGIFAIRDVFVVILLVCISILMFRFGPKGERRRIALTRLDLDQRLLTWPPRVSNVAEIILPFDEITEVVFGMIYFPVSPSRPDTRLHVFTVLVRDASREELMPVIEATPDKRPAFLIAQQIAELTQSPLTQIGEGVWSNPHP